MTIYSNTYADCYEELKTYYPVWYREILEMDAVWQVFGRQLDGLRAGIDRVVNNNFIYHADLDTLAKWEEFLQIPYDASRPVKERQRLVASFFAGTGHFGAVEIKEVVSTFTPSPCSVTFADSTIGVSITRDVEDTFLLSDCYWILLKKIPAHLGLNMTVLSPFHMGLYVGHMINSYKQEEIPYEEAG